MVNLSNCQICFELKVRRIFEDGRLERKATMIARKTCNKENCLEEMNERTRKETRILNAKWFYRKPKIDELFYLKGERRCQM